MLKEGFPFRKVILFICIFLLTGCSFTNEKTVIKRVDDVITLLFIDYDTNEPLEKQFLQVSNSNGTVIYEGLSDENGIIYLEGVENGTELMFTVTTPYGNEEYTKTVSNESVLVFHIYTQPYHVHTDVPIMLQNPILPHGCEITSLTAILHHYNKTITKEDLSDKYLIKQDFYYKNGKKYGSDPSLMYAGNPRNKDGTYAFSEVLVNSATNYFEKTNSTLKVKNISHSSEEAIRHYVDNGIPVQIWVTLDLSPKRMGSGWYLEENNTYYQMITNVHCVVLTNITDTIVTVMDPLKGYVEYDRKTFFKSYEDLNSQALIVYPGFLQELKGDY